MCLVNVEYKINENLVEFFDECDRLNRELAISIDVYPTWLNYRHALVQSSAGVVKQLQNVKG